MLSGEKKHEARRARQREASRKRRANPEYYRKELEKNRLALAHKRATDPAKRAQDQAYRDSPRGRIQTALAVSRHAANENGHVPCNATVEFLLESLTTNCQMCGRLESEFSTRLCLDHDHSTGEFRGWLCSGCNISLGHYEKVKIAAEKYLS